MIRTLAIRTSEKLGDLDIGLEDVPAIDGIEAAADEALHVLKGLLQALRKLIKEKLSSEINKAAATARPFLQSHPVRQS